MMAGAIIAQFLGDSGHGNWVLLTIAVVMRANYGLTRQRRDDRVVGTLIGCVVAAGAVAWLPAGALVAVQGLSLAVVHSFVRLNYRLASVGASVMALVSLHLVQPSLPAPVLARLADTLIGAAIAHLFSYVWPHWEFREAPRVATGLLARLATFASVALNPETGVHDYRLARKNMIEALAALSDSAGRMSIEPTATRKGLDEMAALLIASYGLVAQFSAARLDARLGVAPAPDSGARDWLQAQLAPKVRRRPTHRRRPGRSPPPRSPWSGRPNDTGARAKSRLAKGNRVGAQENGRRDRRRCSSGPEEQGDEKDGEHQKDKKVRDHRDGLLRVSIPFHEVLDAGQPVKEASRDRRRRDPPRIEKGARPEQPNGEIPESKFLDDAQRPRVPDPKDRLRGEAGIGDLAQAGEDQPDADRPEDEPFANEQCQVGAAVRKRRFGDDGDDRKCAHQQQAPISNMTTVRYMTVPPLRPTTALDIRFPQNWIRSDEARFLAGAA